VTKFSTWLAGSFAKGLGPAEIDGVGLDEVGIELMLADDLAEAVADFRAAVVPVGGLRREVLRVPGERSGVGKRTNPLDRADADAVGFAQGPVYSPGFGHPHLGAMDQGRDTGGIGITVTDEARRAGFVNRSSENPATNRSLCCVLFNCCIYSNTPPSMRYSQQTTVTHVPLSTEVQELTPQYRQMERGR